jgi:CRP/FNR family transcriptional regulator, cyclic AMP receptor protein
MPRAKKKKITSTKARFDARAFLDSAGITKKIVQYRRSAVIFTQGDPCDSVMYIQQGVVRLSVLSHSGKEAIVAMLRPGDFLGEGALAGQPVRMGTATAVAASTALIVLHEEPGFSDRFIAYMLSRNIRIEEDLVDQLFNSSEKRLARTLLLLARYGKEDKPQRVLPKFSQEMLAEMIGTTRSRVNFFMNKFRKLGLIEYNGGLKINASLLERRAARVSLSAPLRVSKLPPHQFALRQAQGEENTFGRQSASELQLCCSVQLALRYLRKVE